MYKPSGKNSLHFDRIKGGVKRFATIIRPNAVFSMEYTLELNAIKLHYTHPVKIDLNKKLDP